MDPWIISVEQNQSISLTTAGIMNFVVQAVTTAGTLYGRHHLLESVIRAVLLLRIIFIRLYITRVEGGKMQSQPKDCFICVPFFFVRPPCLTSGNRYIL